MTPRVDTADLRLIVGVVLASLIVLWTAVLLGLAVHVFRLLAAV